MNNRRLSYGLLLALSTALVAGCGETPPAEAPPQPSATPAETPATPPASLTPAPAPAPAAAEPAPAPAPAAKPAKEKWVGKFAQDFQGEVKDAFEADATKKYAKEKDTKKHDEAAKKVIETLAQTTIENTADTHTFSVKGKAVHTIKFEVAKDESTTLTLKLGQDSTAKKDLKGAEITVTFIDDNTFSLKDPFAKDPTKAQTLVFKRL
jgi:predicted lipid-binding transport protein (Tim44 family)